MANKFFTRRFFLDTPVDRFTNRGADHFVGPFKSFWVSDTNNTSFQCDFVINPRDDRGRGIPLRLNQCQGISDKAEEACIEFKNPQAGVWIDITFAQDDLISVGSVAIDLSGDVVINEGQAHNSTKIDLPNNIITEIFPSDSKRCVDSIQCKAGGVFWIGSPTELGNADWKNICHKISLSIDENFEWKNKSNLYAKTDAGASIFSRFREVKV